MTKIKIPHYSMKMQLYPTAAQKEKLDKAFRALHIAFNITFHEVFQKNPEVCTEPNSSGLVWPDFRKITNKKWIDYLRSCNPAVNDAPAAALTTNNGLFLCDGKRAWKDGMNNRPVDERFRREFHFYSKANPRRSFMFQMPGKNLTLSPDNKKVAWVLIPKIGRIKVRGFNHKLWFGENGTLTYSQALEQNAVQKELTVRVSKDTCDCYYISITFSEGKKQNYPLYLETPVAPATVPVGVDVGIKDIAILSTGQKIENKRFKQKKKATLSRLNRKLSRKWGPANPGFRDYNLEIRKENASLSAAEQRPPSLPSKRYLITKRNKALIERRVARQRDTYYHQQTAALVRQSSIIALETLHVKNMLRNHKLAYALSDAAMSDFLAKLKYKAERNQVEVICIGMFEPSSQRCSACGVLYPPAKNLSIRDWRCPQCGTYHDRDVNAAKNILAVALEKGSAEDTCLPPGKPPKQPARPRRSTQTILPDGTEILITFSKEFSKPNNPRYVIRNAKTDQVIDDAQGKGYRSISNAKNCYKAKRKWAQRV